MTELAPLRLCHRCDRYAREPIHLIGMAGVWQGGSRPFPRMKWCTPQGIKVLPFDKTPLESAHEKAREGGP